MHKRKYFTRQRESDGLTEVVCGECGEFHLAGSPKEQEIVHKPLCGVDQEDLKKVVLPVVIFAGAPERPVIVNA